MTRIGLYFALVCAAFAFTEVTEIIKEVFVVMVNTSDSEVFEKIVTKDVEKSQKKTDGKSGIVEIKYVGRKPKPTRTISVTVPIPRPKKRRHNLITII